MTDRQAAIVTAARGWVGTPFMHQTRIRGRGVDCWNLVRAVGEEVAGLYITPQQFRPFEGYKIVPQDGYLRRALNMFLVDTSLFAATEDLPGHVVLIAGRQGDDPKHCAIIGSDRHGRLTLIHAMQKYGGCVEHRLTPIWYKRIVGIYRYSE